MKDTKDIKPEDIRVSIDEEVTCPECKGSGLRPIYENEGPKAGGPECYTCGGDKTVTEETVVPLRQALEIIKSVLKQDAIEYTDAASVILMNEKREVLCVSRKNDKADFGLPGGKVEPGETLVEGAARELFEETGIVVDPEDMELVYSTKPATPGGYNEHVFVVKRYKKDSETVEAGEVRWYLPIQLLDDRHTFAEYNGKLFTHLYKTNTWPAAAVKV